MKFNLKEMCNKETLFSDIARVDEKFIKFCYTIFDTLQPN